MGLSGGFVARVLALAAVMLTLLSPSTSSNSEGDALFTLRKSLNDPDNVLTSWDPTLVNPCTWFHITCNQDNRVTRVWQIPLACSKGRVTGGAFFYRVRSMITLWRTIKYFEQVAGCLHDDLEVTFSNHGNNFFVMQRDLGNSNLSGHLVSDIAKLEHLQYLELYKNNIHGTIPAELGNLKSLISLDLYNNNISGTIPAQLGKLKSLVFLRLNDNKLNGRIPRELTAISSLKVLDVSNNDLCGTIPTIGPFERIPLNNFENNPRLEGPELLGLASYDTNC